MKFRWGKSLLVICETLELFVNTLAANDRYSLLNRDNLTQPIQMQLPQKKTPQFSSTYLKPRSNFEHFKQKR